MARLCRDCPTAYFVFVSIDETLVFDTLEYSPLWFVRKGNLEGELEGCHFLRTHKNYLVNQEYIKEVGNREVYLTDGSVLEMGRDRKKEIREAMCRYAREMRRP